MNPYPVLWAIHGAAAASAAGLSLRHRAHRLVALTLTLGLVADVVAHFLKPVYQAGVVAPYTGWHRAGFHLGQALFTAYPAAFAALALLIGTERERTARRALAVWVLFLAVCIGGYPWLRGPRLGHAYTGAQVAVVAAGVLAVVSTWRRRPPLTTTHAVVFALFLAEASHLVGPFFSSPFADWHYAQIAYSLAFGAASLIQLEALWTTPRSTPSSF